MPQRRFTLAIDGGAPLRGFVDLPDRPGPWPVVVLCHGFKGFCTWGFHPPLAELLASHGLAAVRFNFRGSGMAPGDELVTDPEAFRADTYSAELGELLALLERLSDLKRGLDPGLDADLDLGRVALLGHSRGGGVALLAAAHPEWRERLRALVTWNAIGRCDRWGEREKAAWRAQGELPVANARTGQRLALGLQLLEEVESRAAELDLKAAAARRRAPWLLLHAVEDEAVPVAEGRALAAAAAAPSELVELPGTGHTFGAVHPFAGPTPALTTALNRTVAFLRQTLAE
jgi:pimeloyl-ACP methyl ester carboxylesterase